MSKKFDIHLSAYRLASETVRRVEALGFRRDEFANNNRCDGTVYHGTYRGHCLLPNDSLWAETEAALMADEVFVGGLEEEEFETNDTVIFNGLGEIDFVAWKALPLSTVANGSYKACDIHINIDTERTSANALQSVEALKLASFDKAQSDCIHRVYSATCESVDSGRRLYGILCTQLLKIRELHGRAKFEKTRRYLRVPVSAPALPIVTDEDLAAWIKLLEL